MDKKQLKTLLEQAYNAAWDNAGDGWNGEINGPAASIYEDDKEHFEKEREEAIVKILAQVNAQ